MLRNLTQHIQRGFLGIITKRLEIEFLQLNARGYYPIAHISAILKESFLQICSSQIDDQIHRWAAKCSRWQIN